MFSVDEQISIISKGAEDIMIPEIKTDKTAKIS